jgi:alpha 1,2-mannosyltransferase
MARLNERIIRLAIFTIAVVGIIMFMSSPSVKYENNNVPQDPQHRETAPMVNGVQKNPSTGRVTGYPRQNATFVSLARNSDLWYLAESVRSAEDRFNGKYGYDWVFLNDEPFTEEFKVVMTRLVSGEAKFGIIPKDHWSYPSWIDQGKAAQTREDMKDIIYGSSESYRHMCRFESGFFFKHPLMLDYQYYWRVEPEIKFHCDINFDVFKFMVDNKKDYGFTITIHEFESTIPTLWKTTLEFMKKNPEALDKNNLMSFVSNDEGLSYNLCHFWSNFEVANMDFWRGETYQKYFDYLDKNGGFFYERWGDAPVHSIAASLFMSKDKLHHFSDLGYYHVPYHQCPIDDAVRVRNNCVCNPNDDFTWKDYSCTRRYFDVMGLPKPKGWDKHIG